MFTSNEFEYKKENHKKNGWAITITPKDVSGIQKIYLQISSRGNASLQVTSSNRQPISFNGYIEDNKQLKRGF